MKFKEWGFENKVFGTVIWLYKENISVGDNCTFNHNCFINARAPIKIGDFCRFSPNVRLHAGGLRIDEPYQMRGHFAKPITVEDGVWLCDGVVVQPGVTIGKGSVILPNSVVTKNVKPYTMMSGIPAKKVGRVKDHSGTLLYTRGWNK